MPSRHGQRRRCKRGSALRGHELASRGAESGTPDRIAQMKWTELIDRLAGLAGVEPWYFDLQGRRHETTLAAQVLVLGALGFDVSAIAAVAAAVRPMEEGTCRDCSP